MCPLPPSSFLPKKSHTKLPNKIPVLVIFAPTASGKTELLLNLFADKKGANVISADSMQVYRGMDIGTAKPSLQERLLLPHHLIDIKEPDEQFSVAEFVERADALCQEFYESGRFPIVCGGTGFYIRAFLLGLPSTPPSDERIRQKLKDELSQKGKKAMWRLLLEKDPESAKKIDEADSYRVLRALEIFEIAGKPRGDFAQGAALREKYDFSAIILERSREDLYKRIEARVDKMFEAGLEREAFSLTQKFGPDAPGMQAIGYREFYEKRQDGSPLSPEEIREKIKRDSKKYAKKQYVFTRGIPGAKSVSINNLEEAAMAVKESPACQAFFNE